MGSLENVMLILISILLLCLVVSIISFPVKKQKKVGFKCNSGALGPNKGYCEQINEYPSDDNNLFFSREECFYKCAGVDADKKESVKNYKCVMDTDSKTSCMETNDPEDKAHGIYSSSEECSYKCF